MKMGDSHVWVSVRCLVSFDNGLFEERITLWQAKSMDGAISAAEEAARRYAQQSGGRYLGLAQAYLMSDGPPASGDEVFSLFRESDLDGESYVNKFFDTGAERQQRT